MLESLITCRSRVKLLLRFFLNSQATSYMRELEREIGEQSNAVRLELNRLEKGGLLKSEIMGRKKYYRANTQHPLFNDINSILKKVVGIDKIIDRVTSQIGNLEAAYVAGNFAVGLDSTVIELLLVGQDLDSDYINNLVAKAEKLMKRKISYLVLSVDQMADFFGNKPVLLIWKQDE